jgi:hypothetical protein
MQNINAEVCTKVIKPVKYSIQSGEDFFSILKNFELNPVMGSGGSLEQLQKINHFEGQTSVQAGTEVVIPFKCEEQIMGWRVIDRGEYRLITSTKLEKTPGGNKVKSESMSPDGKTKDILNKAMPGEEGVDLDEVKGDNTDVSDALRYRMICEGEWTGTECISRYSAMYITGAAWYYRNDGTDKTTGDNGVLLSKLNPEIGFGWTQYWNANWRTDLNVAVMNNDIQPEAREVPIEQSKKILNSLTADVRYETGRWGAKAGISQHDRLFYKFNRVNILLPFDGGVVVQAVPVIDYHVGVSYMIKQMGKFRFDTELTFMSLTSTNTSGYVVQPGTGYEISGRITHDRVKEYLFGTVSYGMSQQNTDILLLKTTELAFKFGYAWKLKDW